MNIRRSEVDNNSVASTRDARGTSVAEAPR